jgi:hypothetical protein
MGRANRLSWAAVAVLVLAGCGFSLSHRRATGSLTARSEAVWPSGSRVLRTGVQPLSWGMAAGGSLFLTKDVTPHAEEHTEVIDELMRLDPITGRVLAARPLDSSFSRALLARGSLWVSTESRREMWLSRLDPRSLNVRSRIVLPGVGQTEGLTGSLAVAGGQLWVGGGTLDRVSLATGRVDRVVKLPYPGSAQVAADPTGRVLLAVLGYEHPTYITRLNPQTGSVQARIVVPWSISQPSINGVVDGEAWIYDSGGMEGGSWRIDIDTLKATRTQALPIPANRSFAQVINGVLWVSDPLDDGDGTVEYCADPLTGHPDARLPLLVGNSTFLTADATSVYYLNEPLNSSSAMLERAALDRRCRD